MIFFPLDGASTEPTNVPRADAIDEAALADVFAGGGAITGAIRRVRASLVVESGGTTRPLRLSAFQASAPPNVPGVSLSLTLADPRDRRHLAADARITFTVGVMDEAGAWHDTTLLALGSIDGLEHTRETTEQGIRDSLTLSARDALAARLTKAPPRPLVLYDPATSSYDPSRSNSDLYTADGALVQTDSRATYGLDLRVVLHAAYVAGLGFAAVRTNVPNHPVSIVEFGLQGGFHAGAQSALSSFDTLFYADAEDVLWILDTSEPLPSSILPTPLAVSAVRRMTESAPARPRVSAMIVSYSTNDASEFTTEREIVEENESGTFGNADFTFTTTTSRVREWHPRAQPAAVSRSRVLSVRTETVNHLLETIARSEQTDRTDARGRKVGHTRTVDALVPSLPGDALALLNVESEMQEIVYAAHPLKPGAEIQARVSTRVRGLVAADNENQYRGAAYKLPLIDAHRSGQIADGWTAEFAPIRSTVEQMRIRGDGELEFETTVTDHIANTPSSTRVEPRTGDASLARDSDAKRRVRTIITASGASTGGAVASFDAGEMPSALALTIARRKLARLNAPPPEMRVDLTHVDLALHRASLRTLADRDGALGRGLVTGWTLRGQNLGTLTGAIEQSVDVEMLPG